MENIFEQFKNLKEDHEKLEIELSSPELLSNREQYKVKAKEYADLKKLIGGYDKYLSLEEERNALVNMIQEEADSSEYAILAKKELEDITLAMKKKKKAK